MDNSIFTIISLSLTGLNTIIGAVIFRITQKSNIRIKNNETNVNKINQLIEKELQFRNKTMEISMNKSEGLYQNMNILLDQMKATSGDNLKEIRSKIFNELYDYYWKNVLFIPNYLAGIYMDFLKTGIHAVNIGISNDKFYDDVDKMNEQYFAFIATFKKKYYFESYDISEFTINRIKELETE
jgi:hypothetical protein